MTGKAGWGFFCVWSLGFGVSWAKWKSRQWLLVTDDSRILLK